MGQRFPIVGERMDVPPDIKRFQNFRYQRAYQRVVVKNNDIQFIGHTLSPFRNENRHAQQNSEMNAINNCPFNQHDIADYSLGCCPGSE
jgi:hypothetical protein